MFCSCTHCWNLHEWYIGSAVRADSTVTVPLQDMFTSLTGASKPHHMVNGAGVVLGYSHFGMLAGARWLLHKAEEPLRQALESNPGLQLKIVGHSLGGGTAAMLTMM